MTTPELDKRSNCPAELCRSPTKAAGRICQHPDWSLIKKTTLRWHVARPMITDSLEAQHSHLTMLLPSSCPSRIRQLRQLCKQICQLAFANTSRSPSQRVTNDEDAVCSSQPGGVGERKPKGKRILQEKDRQMYALVREGAQLP